MRAKVRNQRTVITDIGIKSFMCGKDILTLESMHASGFTHTESVTYDWMFEKINQV